MGAPLLDWTIPVSEEFISELKGEKGGMELLDANDFNELLLKAGSPLSVTIGGSTANVARALAILSVPTAFLGIIGEDMEGTLFQRQMETLGITFYAYRAKVPTGRVLCLVTPDTKRTMRTFPGAGFLLAEDHLKPAFFQNRYLVHLTGYLAMQDNILEAAMKKAKSLESKVTLDVGSFEMASIHRDSLLRMIETYVDVLFCNVEEALALTGKWERDACHPLLRLANTVIITNGDKGGFLANQDGIYVYPPVRTQAIDTTGAGDYFVGGYLYGLALDAQPKTCAAIGSKLASEVVKVFGTELPKERWKSLLRWIKTLKLTKS